MIVGHRIAADAWQVCVTKAHELVDCGLGFTEVIRPALQLLLADLDLAALALIDGLPG
ncbi:hypothetical protein D3C76_1830800 [compost metagenome]